MKQFETRDAAQTEALGARLARAAEPGCRIWLIGDLAAGKTTFVRGFLRALGHAGNVVSPTYTLVEPYSTDRFPVHHFDLYRLKDPEELENLGFRDYFDGTGVCLVEWPERGEPLIGVPDLRVRLEAAGSTRRITLEAASPAGETLLGRLEKGDP